MNGRTLDGKYRLIRRVGAGGMGAVYVAERLDGGGPVAIKVISVAAHADTQVAVERFHREAYAAQRIDSPHIARVLDAGTDPETGGPYMVMELLEGQDLHRFTKRVGPLDPDLALRISAQICLGLMKAHEASIIHRDIKAANVFLTRAGHGAITVKVLDFGIAKTSIAPPLDGDSSAGLTRTGMLLGSPLFMSPEQTRGARDLDQRSDLWSLGMVMFRMLAGHAPYEHIRAVGELIFAICSSPPPLVQNMAPWVPPEVARILERLLRLSPDERFQSADELLAAVRAQLPGGERITEAMLTGISPERRAVLAPRLDGAPPVSASAVPSGRAPRTPASGPTSSAPPLRGGSSQSGTEALAPARPATAPTAAVAPTAAPGGVASAPAARPVAPAAPPLAPAARPLAPVAAVAPGAIMTDLAPMQTLSSARADATERGVYNASSLSLLDIPAFRPSRTPWIIACGVFAVVVVVALLHIEGSHAPDEDDEPAERAAADPMATAVEPPKTAPAPPPAASSTPSVRADKGAARSTSAPTSLDRASPLRGPATRWSPGAVPPKPPPPSPDAQGAPAPAASLPGEPLDPNGFGGRK